MDKLKMQTPDRTQENIERIAKLFPNVITEVEDETAKDAKGTKKYKKVVDFDLLRQMLSGILVEGGDERYRLDWPGKKASLLKANIPITKTLRPCREESVNFDTTENIYIEGDNFEVLKILQESYLGKIKVIIIDPPYNTGNDFIYKDDFKKSKDEYEEEIGVEDEEGGKLFRNTDSNGRFHSDWLSMMYERLIVARDLLRGDGVIFISIDDNEVHNVRKICDDIFGEENFIGDFIKKSKVGGGSDSKYIATEHEYIVSYSKNITELPEMFEAHDDEYLKRYKEADEKGRFFWDTFARPGLKNPINYDIETPDGSLINGDWIWSKKRYENAYNNKEIKIIKKQDGSYSVHFKQYLNLSGKKPRSMSSNFGGTYDGKKEVVSLFNSDKIFSYPKSTMHIKKLLEIIAPRPNDTILDFFSGSSTTAHAVMQLNAEDGLNLKFIMVQIPEPCDENSEAYKAGYKTIADIGKERIRRAGKKILQELEGKKIMNGELPMVNGKSEKQKSLFEDKNNSTFTIHNSQLDFGFRVYKTDTTNMKEVFYHPYDMDQKQISAFMSNIKEDRTPEDLLTQVILDLGLELSLPIEQKTMHGNNVFIVQTNALVACFDNDIDFKIIDEIAHIKPLKVVFKDASFKDDKDRINVEERFKRLSPETRVTVL
ncbi:MAG: site-specific DNA-methyltransferase [Desulfatiglans sp.]|nr:site-specific DNA-methyltransferase [Desulfatiglans sp.]